jgi:hypothetical protein
VLITDRYKDTIAGVISCYDRIILQGTVPQWCYDKAMTTFLYSQKIRIFDYPTFASKLRDDIISNTQRIAREQGVAVEFIRKVKAFRKEERIKAILKQRGEHPGLVHIFSAMESCTSYKPWHDKKSGKTFLKYDSGKCLHYYFYFIDAVFGLCYLRVPTWCPFRLQFYCNGHSWLSHKLTKAHIAHNLQENAFLCIDRFEKAQTLSDAIKVEQLHKALDLFARRYCPAATTHAVSYHWSIMQVEYATDIVFKRQSDLHCLYEPLIRIATHSVKPENIASFLGHKLHLNYQGEMGNNFNTRILGTRIKHQMGAVAIKMYDKFGIMLRIETTVNDVSQFKIFREVTQRTGARIKKHAAMKKNIYSLFPLSKLLEACNNRYLEFISTLEDPSQGIKNLNHVAKTMQENNRSYSGFNFYDQDDQKLLEVLARGEFNINGLYNKYLRAFFPDKSSSSISRILKRLNAHGLIKKVAKTYKYYLTRLGKAVITTGLAIKEMFVIPRLAEVKTCYR